jgi:starch synthase
MVVLGTGEAGLETALRQAAARYPEQIAVRIEYDEQLAHLLEAGSDIFLMPSRFEPCGLNQIYSLRYGTPPVVRNTGGLADTIVDTSKTSLADGSANGFCFDRINATALLGAIDRALDCYSNADTWEQLQRNGMAAEYSWTRSAAAYTKLYARILNRDEKVANRPHKAS